MPSFLRHGRLWVSPKNVALASFSSNPPALPCNIAKITTFPIDIKSTEALLLTRKKLSAFYDITTQCSPCVSVGSPEIIEIWQSFKNNQMPNERAIGLMKKCVLEGKVKDSTDEQDDEEIDYIDNRMRGYVTSMMQ